MLITAGELRQLADEVDDLHRDAMRTVRDELEHLHAGGASRRRFLSRAVTGGLAVTVGSAVVPFTRFLPAAWAQAAVTDLDIAKFGESVELAAVDAYTAATGTGKLDPGATHVATLFAGHHQEHAGAFEGILGDQAGHVANKKILDTFGPMITAAADQAAIFEIVYGIEEAAAATYLFALGTLLDAGNAAAVATIMPVESQHAVVLAQALGKDISVFLPSFETTQQALKAADWPIGG